jgi:glutathione S-transferase
VTATLYVGNRNYSSWSIRGSLLVRASGLACQDVVIPLNRPESRAKLLEVSPSGRVPALHHEERIVWDSLAIAEYLHELCPEARLWPATPEARAQARSVSAEMHAGFGALRRACPMDMRARRATPQLDADTAADIARIEQIWTECRARYGRGGDYLFGAWCAADAMFAPVVSRFRSYAIRLRGPAQAYADAVWEWPALAALATEAGSEPWEIDLGLPMAPARR